MRAAGLECTRGSCTAHGPARASSPSHNTATPYFPTHMRLSSLHHRYPCRRTPSAQVPVWRSSDLGALAASFAEKHKLPPRTARRLERMLEAQRDAVVASATASALMTVPAAAVVAT